MKFLSNYRPCMQIKSILLCTSVLLSSFALSYGADDVAEFNKSDLVLPKLMGVAINEFQNSGAATVKDSNWADWENKDCEEHHTIHDGQKSGTSCDHWNLYRNDITLVTLSPLKWEASWLHVHCLASKV
jgi:hypothetical protein